MSTDSKALTLSPVTVQNDSVELMSKPVIEQLPPATISGSRIE